MKTPAFWSKRGLLAAILYPVSVLYEIAFTARFYFTKPERVGVPVLCVGGLTAGGAGKTPVCLQLGEICKELDIKAWFVSRGYKGKFRGPIQVKPKEHTAYEVGDEPLLLASVLPTIIAKKRVQGAQFAARQGAELIIMDDGFQNPAIHKDISLLVIDGNIGLGNGFLLPAGPLRELSEDGFKRANAVIFINPNPNVSYLPETKPIYHTSIKTNAEAESLRGKNVLAFCGLAYPQKFFDTLRSVGAHVIVEKTFPDHYQYTDEEIDALALAAKKQDAVLVTTSKDAARMTSRALTLITIVHVTLEFAKPEALRSLLMQMVGRP